MELDRMDLSFAVRRLPATLKNALENKMFSGKVFVAGGYITSVVTGAPINDVDVFVPTMEHADVLAKFLADGKKDIHKTKNAMTIKSKVPVQVITRWLFKSMDEIVNSFDFTVNCAAFGFFGDDGYKSFCHDRFYKDIAGKRLIYQSPVRNEDAGGSILRVLKYYQKGYRIPLDSLGKVIARLNKGVDPEKMRDFSNEEEIAKVLTGLLREVDPNTDPLRRAHLPSNDNIEI